LRDVTHKGFGSVNRRIIEQHIGFFVQLCTALIETRYYRLCVDRPVDQYGMSMLVRVSNPKTFSRWLWDDCGNAKAAPMGCQA
jgi:hypothetical protein